MDRKLDQSFVDRIYEEYGESKKMTGMFQGAMNMDIEAVTSDGKPMVILGIDLAKDNDFSVAYRGLRDKGDIIIVDDVYDMDEARVKAFMEGKNQDLTHIEDNMVMSLAQRELESDLNAMRMNQNYSRISKDYARRPASYYMSKERAKVLSNRAKNKANRKAGRKHK